MPDPQPSTIPHIAEAAARRWGDDIALIEGEDRISFADLWADARAVASALRGRGVGDGGRVAIWAPNRREWIAAALGTHILGAAIVPLNTRYKGREAADIIRRAGCTLLFTVGDFLGSDYRAMLADEALDDLAHVIAIDSDWDAFLAGGSGADDAEVAAALARLTPDHVSDIMFTSGTTGAPKGALATHGRVIGLMSSWSEVTSLAHGDRMLIANPFFHSFGYKAGWVACLITGATMLPMAMFSVDETIRLIEQEKVSFVPGAPTIYQSLLAERAGAPFDSSSLRVAVTGAASVPPVLVERMYSELGFDIVVTAYGMTECTAITICRAGDPIETIAYTCGRAVPGLEVRITGEEGEALAAGETGEIWVRGYGVMRGYLDDPEATTEAIDAEGWLHTGDVGTMDDEGYLRITDRKKDMYICGGFNCYPAEIENLLSAHPDVEMVAVVGVSDERMGEVGKAYIIPRAGRTPDEADIIAWSRDNMANYKVPRSIAFVDDLPRNASGKVLKTELR